MMETMIIHNSHQKKYRCPFGALPCGSLLTLGLEVSTQKSIDSVQAVISTDFQKESRYDLSARGKEEECLRFAADITLPQEPGLLWYYFELVIDGVRYYYGNNESCLGGLGSIYGTIPPKYQITVFREGAETPYWFKRAIVYQIFTDRFRNGSKDGRVLNPKKNSFIYANWEDTPAYVKDCENGSIARWDFFGGNLQGVVDKLDYLKELGVSVIYLNPIFEAPSNHKYDTGDYKNIDPMFGSSDTFRSLCEEAGKAGIYVILDGVFSHTGSDSIYFNKHGSYPGVGAYQSPESPYYSWYRFKHSRDDYDCWWGVDSLPNVNEMDPGYVDFIITGQDSVIKHWMDMGAKGWRLDVADELPDEFIRLIRKEMKKKDAESVLMGEVWEDASNKISYGMRRAYLLGDELDSLMNYPFREIMIDFFCGRLDGKTANDKLMSIYENYPVHNFYCNMNLIGSHDVPRILTLLGEAPPEHQLSQVQKERYRLPEGQKALAVARLKLLSLIQMTFPGVPSIYYGDEAGLEGYSDPLNRGTYPWGNENRELLDWYKKITSIRNKYDVLSTGRWIPLEAYGDVYGYARRIENSRDVFGEACEDNTALVLVNRSKESRCRLSIDISSFTFEAMYDLLEDCKKVELSEGRLDITLGPLQGKLFIQKL